MKRTVTAAVSAISLALLMILSVGCGDDKPGQGVPAGGGQINPQYSQDVRMYEQALSADPKNPDILIQLGNKYYDWGEEEIRAMGNRANPVPKWQKGVEYYKRALEITPGNSDVRTDMANLLNWMGLADEAEREYRTASNMNPSHPQSRINLILLLGGNKGEYKEAVALYEELIKTVPEQKGNEALAAEVEKFKQMMTEAGK